MNFTTFEFSTENSVCLSLLKLIPYHLIRMIYEKKNWTFELDRNRLRFIWRRFVHTNQQQKKNNKWYLLCWNSFALVLILISSSGFFCVFQLSSNEWKHIEYQINEQIIHKKRYFYSNKKESKSERIWNNSSALFAFCVWRFLLLLCLFHFCCYFLFKKRMSVMTKKRKKKCRWCIMSCVLSMVTLQ